MKSVIYLKPQLASMEEINEATKFFNIVCRRTSLPIGSLVIPRYSVLPYYKELEDDLKSLGCTILNSYREHVFVANIINWYSVLEAYTPETWFALDRIPDNGPFVLKGSTNSKKNLWSTHMFAKNKSDAIHVYEKLTEDGYIGTQNICIRRYVPLKKLCDTVVSNCAPVSEEYRFFVLDGRILCGGFYWSEHTDRIVPGRIDVKQNVPQDFLEEVVNLVSPNIRFFVVDIARTESGKWIVIELNDAQMSGLCSIPPKNLYAALYKCLG